METELFIVINFFVFSIGLFFGWFIDRKFWLKMIDKEKGYSKQVKIDNEYLLDLLKKAVERGKDDF